MTDLSWLLLAAAGVLAVGNWIAVALKAKWLEYFFKPATMVALIAATVAMNPRSEASAWAFVAALGFSLIGDVLLMLPRDLFIGGVGAFFLAHVAYIVGLRIGQTEFTPLLMGAAVAFFLAAVVGRPILAGVTSMKPDMRTPVSAYIAVISVMVAAALATGEPFAATGALVFMASDTLIAWNRFVKPLSWAPVVIMVTYHIGQAGLVLSLSL
ncbi:MAG: lysoplasmalogenase [Actinomycetota bacterium]